MAKRQACCNKERILVSTRWSKLPRYRTMFVIFAIEIWRSNRFSKHATSLATIFARSFTSGLFSLEPMYAMYAILLEKPKYMCDLCRRVNRFAENIDEEALREMVRRNRKRAALCIDSLGGHFKQLL